MIHNERYFKILAIIKRVSDFQNDVFCLYQLGHRGV
jgi:hypothetical protein